MVWRLYAGFCGITGCDREFQMALMNWLPVFQPSQKARDLGHPAFVGSAPVRLRARKFWRRHSRLEQCIYSLSMTDQSAKLQVFITVVGGVAYVAEAPEGVDVHIVDYDDLKEDFGATFRSLSPEEKEFYWRAEGITA